MHDWCQWDSVIRKKTSLSRRLLEHNDALFTPEPEKVIYFYGQHQKAFDDMEKRMLFIDFLEGLPSKDKISEMSSLQQHLIVVLDDLMQEIMHNKVIENLLTRASHHLNIIVIFLVTKFILSGQVC